MQKWGYNPKRLHQNIAKHEGTYRHDEQAPNETNSSHEDAFRYIKHH
jgi:phosphoribosylformylglycinamidine (FGAM) synthase-like amidotransferase family enzyme